MRVRLVVVAATAGFCALATPSGARGGTGRALPPARTRAIALAPAPPDRPPTRSPAPTTTWDHRVLPIVRFVEHARGLSFKHPVPVRFLDETAFLTQLRAGQGHLNRSDRAQLDEASHTISALGLGEVDGTTLYNDENTLNASDVLAFYDPDRKAVFIRGTALDTAGRVTVAHELAHALQDQYFNLNRLNSGANRRGSEAADAVTALVEGDAVNVEDQFVSTLRRSEQNKYFANQNRQAAANERAVVSSVPAVLQALDQAPYDLGPTFVEALIKTGGHQRLNQAFARPPANDAQIINPAGYVAGTKPLQVAAPRLQPGETPAGKPDSLGALGLYYTLAARLGPVTALKATNAWGADRFTPYQRGASRCVRLTMRGVHAHDTATLAEALTRWAAQGPAATASIHDGHGTVTLQACDPGLSAVPARPRIQSAATQLAGRASLLSQAMDGGLPPLTAQCTADHLIADPAVLPLLTLDQPTKVQMDEFDTKIKDAVAACTTR